MTDEEINEALDKARQARLRFARAIIAHDLAMEEADSWPRPDSPPDPAFRVSYAGDLDRSVELAADTLGDAEKQYLDAYDAECEAYEEDARLHPPPPPEEWHKLPGSRREALGMIPANHLDVKLQVVRDDDKR